MTGPPSLACSPSGSRGRSRRCRTSPARTSPAGATAVRTCTSGSSPGRPDSPSSAAPAWRSGTPCCRVSRPTTATAPPPPWPPRWPATAVARTRRRRRTASRLPLLRPLRPALVAVEAAAVHGDLREPRVADDPNHRPVGVAVVLAAVDGALGEQRAALVDHMRAGRHDHDQLAAEHVDLQRDLAPGQYRVGQVD